MYYPAYHNILFSMFQEAKEMIEKSVSLWLPQLQENDDDIPEVSFILESYQLM